MRHDRYFDDDEEMPRQPARDWRFDRFDCPECDASNPWDDGFGDGDEVMCFYCGTPFQVRVDKEGRLRLVAD